MNPIDEAINDLLASVGGNWRITEIEPATLYEAVSPHAGNYVGGLKVTLLHGELDATVTGQAATLGNAVADAVRKIHLIAQEASLD